MAQSYFDKVAEGFAEHSKMYDPEKVAAEDKEFMLCALKRAVLSDVKDEYIRQVRMDADAEAKRYRNEAFTSAERYKKEALASAERYEKEALAEAERKKKIAEKEAKDYKKTLFRKARKRLVAETMGTAFFIGIMINQATLAVPEEPVWMVGTFLVSLLICVLFVLLET